MNTIHVDVVSAEESIFSGTTSYEALPCAASGLGNSTSIRAFSASQFTWLPSQLVLKYDLAGSCKGACES